MLQKAKNLILSHKIVIGVATIILILGIYFLIKNNSNAEVSYITEEVKIGNIQTVVTGIGQIEASSTITLKAKTTGDITYVNVIPGQEVKRGQLIASVDSRDAKVALENAKISLAKLTSVDSLNVLQDKNSLMKSYSDGWSNVASFVSDTTIMIDEMNVIYDRDGFLGSSNILNKQSSVRSKVLDAENSFYKSKKGFDSLVKNYKNLSISSSNEEINKLIIESYEQAKLISVAVKKTEESFNAILDSSEITDSSVASNRTNISSWINDSNNYVNSLLLSKNSITENVVSLSNDLDIRSAELSLQSKQDAYNDCFIRAPFDGVIATLTAKIGESSGSSVGTLITKEKIVVISLNEVDISSVKTGQNVGITFDAVSDLIMSGTVVEIDSVGTVNSGVVTYNVKVKLNEDNNNIKPGMSVSVEIITNYKENIPTVSSSSIKTKNGKSYVEILSNDNSLEKKYIEVGISDDTKTEVLSGLEEGDIIVSKILSGTSTSKSSSSAPSILSSMGAGSKTGAGNNMRVPHD